ncbi:MAG: PQQ-binding-like beta-propeller repeat protein, partial [Verrucomicrobiales bacterium]|nr:PQQ-binding-like beta-propeller repeat protein [Verrucomicrobiales bacterium]
MSLRKSMAAASAVDQRSTRTPAAAITWILPCILAVSISASGKASSTDWPQFRGPRFDNNFPGERIPAEFGPDKNVAWKKPIPSGHGSPCIVGDQIFLTAFDGTNSLETLSLNRRNGGILWRRPIAPDRLETYFTKLGSPATSTCASDGQRVISYFGSFGLLCYDLDGRELWRVPLPLPQTDDGFGSGTSPILHDGMAYLLRDEDGPGQGIYAFDVKSGKEVWKRKRDGFRISFGSPVIWDGCVVAIGDLRLKAYDLKTGGDRWVAHGFAACPCTTPAPGSDGNLYVATWSNGAGNERNMPEWKDFLAGTDRDKDGKVSKSDTEGTGLADFFSRFDRNQNGFIDREEWQRALDGLSRGKNVVLALKPGGQGDITETHVRWTNTKGAPYVASPLFHEGRLYLVKDGGLLTVYETSTGKVLADKERLGVIGDYYASPVAVGGKIIIASQSGVVLALKAGEQPEVLSQANLGESIFATPVVADNTLYVRTASHLWAFRDNGA